MLNRCPGACPLITATIKDYKLMFSNVLHIEPAKGEEVIGALYSVTDLDTKQLDLYEGYPQMYNRKTIETVEGIECFFYYMNNPNEKPPSREYYYTVKQGFKDWNLDMEYLDEALEQSYETEFYSEVAK